MNAPAPQPVNAPRPDSMWLVICEYRLNVIRISADGKGFFIPGQEPCWHFKHVDKWLLEITIMMLEDKEKELASQNRKDAELDYMGNLLAMIHCDGGHYRAEHGTKKATDDAIEIVSKLKRERDSLTTKLAAAELAIGCKDEALQSIASLSHTFRSSVPHGLLNERAALKAISANPSALWNELVELRSVFNWMEKQVQMNLFIDVSKTPTEGERNVQVFTTEKQPDGGYMKTAGIGKSFLKAINSAIAADRK